MRGNQDAVGSGSVAKSRRSNAQLSDQVASYAAQLFYTERGYPLSVSEDVVIGNAAYAAFNSATVIHDAKETK